MKITMASLTILAGLAYRHSASAFSHHSKKLGNLRQFSFGLTAQQREQIQAAAKSSCLFGSTSDSLATSFDDGTSPYLVTTPIYYVNDKPHIGHAYTSTACDVIARYMRLSGREVFFLSGTDEHGQKVETSAGNKGVAPQDFVDEVSVNFRELLDMMNISNDYFIRTTDDSHKKSVQVSKTILVSTYINRERIIPSPLTIFL